jgi:hypothetical protein
VTARQLPVPPARGIRSPGRAAIGARTLRADRWWAYPLTTFMVLLAFVAYAAYAAIANRDYYAAPYLSPFYSPCLSIHCGMVPGSHGVPHLVWLGNFAWASLMWVALTDLYVRLVASGAIHDPRFF